jgi:hypothetical protein
MVQGIPPPHLQALIDSVAAGWGLRLYILINKLLRARGLAPKAGQMPRIASGLALKVISGLRLQLNCHLAALDHNKLSVDIAELSEKNGDCAQPVWRSYGDSLPPIPLDIRPARPYWETCLNRTLSH